MPIKRKDTNTVTVDKGKYEALVHSVQVTKEFIQGKSESFKTPDELIKNLKNL